MDPSQTDSRLGRQLWRQTWPMAIGVLSLLGFQLVDSAFIARLGTSPLAAQSFTFPLTFLIIGVQVGIGIAIAALISRALGAGEELRARRLGTLVMALGTAVIGVLCVLLWVVQEPVFTTLGADAPTREMIHDYWAPQLLAAWGMAIVYFAYSLFRSHGNTRVPGSMMVLTSLLNLVLDPLLIFGVGSWDGLGLAGAAWATVGAFVVAAGVLGVRLVKLDWLAFSGLKQEWRASSGAFAGVAGPAMAGQLMPPLAAMLAIYLVAKLGESAVAAWGLAGRLETVSLMVVLALTMSLPPWLGRCYGAGDWNQIRRLLRLTLKVVVIWQLSLGICMALLAPWLAQVLAGNPEVRSDLVVLIRFLLPSYAALGVCMLVVSAGNALGWPLRAMLLSATRLFICYLPCLWLGVTLFGNLAGLGLGAAFGNVLAGAAAFLLLQRTLAGPKYQKAEQGATKVV